MVSLLAVFRLEGEGRVVTVLQGFHDVDCHKHRCREWANGHHTSHHHLLPPEASAVTPETDERARVHRSGSQTVKADQGVPRATISERLRPRGRIIHPAISLPLKRIVPPGGTTICGHFFEAGTVVGMNAWVVHRDKKIFGQDTDS